MPFQPGTPTTPQEAASNWVSGSTAKAQKWVTNTLRPKVMFTDAAIAQAPEWLSKIQQVGTAGYIAGMNRAKNNIDKIAANIQTNGAAAYSSGVQNKSYKYSGSAQNLIPAIQSLARSLPPRGTTAQNIQRATQFMQGMAALRGQYRG